MMHNKAKKILITKFGPDDPLHILRSNTFVHERRQIEYLIDYLADLGACTVIEEPNYFDRDYLAEFSSFYSISSTGYPNVCRRVHFFSSELRRESLRSFTRGTKKTVKDFQDSYLGFVVIRPIKAAPLGRTILKWYPENSQNYPRINAPKRVYSVHLAGVTLKVEGLAWQQQDTGVGACATVGLWTMLHSSAFDDHHAIPTTAEITKSAHSTASMGSRVFPSTGLTIHQMCEAIKANELAPMLFEGDVSHNGITLGFTRERFSTSCASLVRSGYPVLILGELEGVGGHAVCVVGFRSSAPPNQVQVKDIGFGDCNTPNVYIHDDNIGPNARFEINVQSVNVPKSDGTIEIKSIVTLDRKAPAPLGVAAQRLSSGTYPRIIPRQLLVAVHNDLRTSPDTLHIAGYNLALKLYKSITAHLSVHGVNPIPLILSTRFLKLASFLGAELGNTLGSNTKILGRVRLDLVEKISPMSLHIGLVRIGLPNGTPLLDVLYDTTDSDRNHPIYTSIAYQPLIYNILSLISKTSQEYGVLTKGY